MIEDFGAFELHQTYVVRLKKDHGRKHGFWLRVDECWRCNAEILAAQQEA